MEFLIVTESVNVVHVNILATDFRGNTPLQIAAMNNDFEMCKFLLQEYNPDVEVRLHFASSASFRTFTDLVQDLLYLQMVGD